MAGIKQLAGQTIWYGGSNIISKLLNYFLTPYLTAKLTGSDYGDVVILYAVIAFLNIAFTYGMETGYFKFSQNPLFQNGLFNTIMVSIIVSTILLTATLFAFAEPIAVIIDLSSHVELVKIAILIIAVDTLAAIPFAKLRNDNKPKKYAFVKITGILVNIAALYFFLSVCPALAQNDPNSVYAFLSSSSMKVSLVFIANLIMSIWVLLLLLTELKSFKWKFDFGIWKTIMLYSLPLLIVGFGGMINETLDRLMLGWWSSISDEDARKLEVGTYGACAKLAILITIFIQAFRMGAEPFFFKQSTTNNAPKVYARVMKFFVIVLSIMFLVVAMYMDVWKHFIQNAALWKGLKIVPILLLANIFLGIYYNLSVWYKVTNKTMSGAWITIIGTVITVVINYIFIPTHSYVACAWATLFCYGTMMVLCYIWGQKYYPVPYAWKKLLAYLVIMLLVFGLFSLISSYVNTVGINLAIATILIGLYILFIARIEKQEFQKLPVIGKLIK